MKLELPEDRADVWKVFPETENAPDQILTGLLSHEEKQQADRLRNPRKRRLSICNRVALRKILGLYLEKPPESIQISRTAQGKPHLTGSDALSGIHFNISHTEELCVIALGLRPLGVDVEKIRDDLDYLGLAHRYFTPKEYEEIIKSPPHLRLRAFYRCWTRREAYIKAKGSSINELLGKIAVSVLSPRITANFLDPEDIYRWSLVDLEVGVSYISSLAVYRNPVKIRYLSP